MRRLAFLALALLWGTTWAAGGLHTEEVTYDADGTALEGFLAYDADLDVAQRPGVLVVHEWWGHNEYVRRRARMLAELGYTALALDMYGKGRQARHPDEAGEMASQVRRNLDLATRRFEAALELLRGHGTTDPTDMAAIGYCFGGGIVLEMARAGVELDAVASFHGTLAPRQPARPGAVNAQVLVLHGADDPFVSDEQVAQFKAEMERAGVDYRFISYEGAKHAFTNPRADEYAEEFDLPLAYDAEADRKSWAELTRFLEQVFRD
ncbi:MAG: dienelactone hydrolase family protein [Gammaproteobacteria bacterium]|nr:dienelactone hydrolase family protein [Gammaproteobacteria bacterium]